MPAEFEVIRDLDILLGQKLTNCFLSSHFYSQYTIRGETSSGEKCAFHYGYLKPLNCEARKIMRDIQKELKR